MTRTLEFVDEQVDWETPSRTIGFPFTLSGDGCTLKGNVIFNLTRL